MKLVLIRHGESEWNQKNLFTGWTDVGLTETGREEARNAGLLLRQNGFDFDVCYTSYLKRAIDTLNLVLEQLDREWLPVIKSWKLNERHYGALQGLNKSDVGKKYGEAQLKIWRRSYDIRPPALAEEDERNPALQMQYRDVDPQELPLCESLKDTVQRTIPYFENVIFDDMKHGKRVLIAAHGNSIRALIKKFDGLSDQEIAEVNVPTGVPLFYEFGDNGEMVDRHYLGDPELIRSKIAKVENQGKVTDTKLS